jgi:hypothetical protein
LAALSGRTVGEHRRQTQHLARHHQRRHVVGALRAKRLGDQRGRRRLAELRADVTAEREHHQVEPPVAGAGEIPVEHARHLVPIDQDVAVVEVAVDDRRLQDLGTLATIDRRAEHPRVGRVDRCGVEPGTSGGAGLLSPRAAVPAVDPVAACQGDQLCRVGHREPAEHLSGQAFLQ